MVMGGVKGGGVEGGGVDGVEGVVGVGGILMSISIVMVFFRGIVSFLIIW